ncbi:hypothetical protein Calkro_2444 [Caldicellulosiruptor kronotskyensis 2002]|uniref:Uncharacterized protein n=1 Tax=Caldicellulosiruptor kronotskyensis (strain DSM 18902 / VKM B-2412 / 2002) TaxID=632348 RepID=E4SHN0_CALK2|nr:hypothetical protein [Caldicellulosiruptor kronotskyensis]ADQ47255.1 hypothetical protein Calkro_2444 [Caldicellulosiruptor kronotskyensis 2002]
MNERFNFDELKRALEESIFHNKIKFEDFAKTINSYKNLGFELEKMLEWAANNAKGEDKIKLWSLYKEFSLQNVSELCERLRWYGENLRKSKVYDRFFDKDKKVPRAITFRVLELTRLGKREEVFHIILREFVNAQEEVGKDFVKAFSPKYSVESFKVMVYSFLSGLLGEEKEKNKEKNKEG